MSDSRPVTAVPAPVAPHPVLKDYYADEAARKQRVNALFDASARHYDWITSMMSFGSGRWYRRDALLRHGLKPGMQVLDVGAGTGVMSLIAQETVGATGEVIALDPSEGMLEVARASGVKKTITGRGENLPFEANRFDLLTMGYALRHVADLVQTFSEYRRVLKPEGSVLLLEITRPQGRGPGYWLLRFYMKWVIPLITRLFRRSADAQELMRYYWDTIEHCVPPATILAALEAAGLHAVKRRVVMGIFSEYSATKYGSTNTDRPMSSLTAAELELSALLIAALNLEGRDPANTDPEAPLFGSHERGWGLDSIDALEIALAIQQKYGVELRSEDEASKRAFASIRALAEHVAANRKG